MKLKNKSSFYALPKRTSVPLGEPLHSLRFFNLKDMENWKDIPGFEGSYQVSDLGRVRSLDRNIHHGKSFQFKPGIILSPRKQNSGYYCVNLSTGTQQRKNYTVHRLVMKTFIGESQLTVNHINEDKSDNRLCNLEYMTHAENVTYSRGVKLLDKITNKIYLSRRDAARDLYSELGYKQWDCLHTALRREAPQRIKERFQIINA